jgi:predicted secreted protein
VRTVCYLAHCLLNANAKVDEGARCAGVSAPVLRLLREHGAAIRQMPCPELAVGGTRRCWVIIGIDGSPSMGVELTASAGDWGGRPDKPRDEDYPVTPGPGLFTETLLELLGDGVGRARVVGIGQDLFDYDEPAELAKLAAAVEDTGAG